jgi:hypothetical protein
VAGSRSIEIRGADGAHVYWLPPNIELAMRSTDGAVSVRVLGREADGLPVSSCFNSLQQASAFFEGGILGYSAARDYLRSDGVFLRTEKWSVRALDISDLQSSYFEDTNLFPAGTVQFDHALVMRDIVHEWHSADVMKHDELDNQSSPVPSRL